MGHETGSDEVREITLVNTDEASFKGSGYDARLILDTTPTSRVDWATDLATDPQSEQRSAYDSTMIIDTTPTMRVEPDPALTDGADAASASSSDQ